MITGTITALVTPFLGDAIDYDGLQENIQLQLDAGIEAILLLGITGEAPTISDEERTAIIKLGVKMARKKAHIIVGTGTYSTQKTIDYTLEAQDLGADSALIVTPYYNCPTQEGIFLHFEAISNACDLPFGIYNAPTRAGKSITTETMLRICQLPTAAFIKECSESIEQMQELLTKIDANFPIFTGNDSLAFCTKALGGAGVISVASNLIPHTMYEFMQMDVEEARDLHFELFPLFRALFLETNPIPIKTAMNIWSMAAGPCRLPLCEMKKSTELALVLKEYEYLCPRVRA
jgi:4-hydroxy-tetrahydrodipicolinate synthase